MKYFGKQLKSKLISKGIFLKRLVLAPSQNLNAV